MAVRKLLSVLVVASLLTGALPTPSQAAGETLKTKAATVDLRGSINREVARVAAQTPPDHARQKPRQERAVSPGGGGGSSMLIWTLVGTAAAVGTTYYVMKQVKKETSQVTQ